MSHLRAPLSDAVDVALLTAERAIVLSPRWRREDNVATTVLAARVVLPPDRAKALAWLMAPERTQTELEETSEGYAMTLPLVMEVPCDDPRLGRVIDARLAMRHALFPEGAAVDPDAAATAMLALVADVHRAVRKPPLDYLAHRGMSQLDELDAGWALRHAVARDRNAFRRGWESLVEGVSRSP